VSLRMLLAKNPAGWQEAIDMLGPAPRPVVASINARIADGRDPSWLWDVPFERLRGRFVVATGERGRDLAVRLHYAEVEHQFVADELDAIRRAAARSPRGGSGAQLDGVEVDGVEVDGVEVDVAANYSSFQQIRKAVGSGGTREGDTGAA
jgi:hypothetical protein